MDSETINQIKKDKVAFFDTGVTLVSVTKKIHNKKTTEYAKVVNPENIYIPKASEKLELISGNTMVQAESHLREGLETEWLSYGSNFELIEGPTVQLLANNKDFEDSEKGLMLYSSPNGNAEKLITSQGDSFKSNNVTSFLSSGWNEYKEIIYQNKPYYVKIDSIKQLKGKVCNKSNFNYDSLITPNDDLFLLKDSVLGFPALLKDHLRSFDFISFTKDVGFTKKKDKMLIRKLKSKTTGKYVEKRKTVQTRIPYKSQLKIIEKVEVFGYYAYKVKISKLCFYLHNSQLTPVNGNTYSLVKGTQYKTNSVLNMAWLFDCKITPDSIQKGENYTAQNASIAINLIQKNFDYFKNKTYSLTDTSGNCYQFLIDVESISDVFYIENIDNFTLNEKDQTLTSNNSKIDFEVYEQNPFTVRDIEISKDNEFVSDEGGLLKYENTEYYAIKADGKSAFVKKEAVEEKNILDWNEVDDPPKIAGRYTRKISAVAATIGFIIYSVVNGLTLSVIFLAYELYSIVLVFFISAAMFLAMAIFGMKTKSNLNSIGRYFTMALVGTFIAVIVNIFLKSQVLDFTISIVSVLIFTGLTAYDAQRLTTLQKLRVVIPVPYYNMI